jgi:hypothetical protein
VSDWLPRGGTHLTLARYAGVTMASVLYVIAVLFSVALFGFVIYMFVWAARKDGEDDRALQKKLGIRRKTRLGL